MIGRYNMLKRILHYLRDVYGDPKIIIFKQLYRRNENAIILLGTPIHKNLGDHLIAQAERLLLKEIYSDKYILEIPTNTYLRYKKFIDKNNHPNQKVFITGGGWMGSLWPDDERFMEEMIESYPNNPIIILPQTVFYDPNMEESSTVLRHAKDIYKKNSSLRMCFRDEKSYQFALDNFELKQKDICLAPDIALYYPLLRHSNYNKNGVGIYLRKDREQIVCKGLIDVIFKCLGSKKKFRLDTISTRNIPVWKRKWEIKKTIKRMSRLELIVTDRLHAMVYSRIAQTKCIAIGNKTGKVKGIYEKWLRDDPNILFLEADEDISLVADKVRNFLDQNCLLALPDGYVQFDTLKKFILENMNNG